MMRQLFKVIVPASLLTEEHYGLEPTELVEALEKALNVELEKIRTSGLNVQSMLVDKNDNLILLLSDRQ